MKYFYITLFGIVALLHLSVFIDLFLSALHNKRRKLPLFIVLPLWGPLIYFYFNKIYDCK